MSSIKFLLEMTSHLIIQIQHKKTVRFNFLVNVKMMKTKSISKCIENHHLNKSNLSIKAFYLSKTRFLVRIDVLFELKNYIYSPINEREPRGLYQVQ